MNKIALELAKRIFDQPLIGNQYRSAFIEEMIKPYLKPLGWRHVGDNWGGSAFQHADKTRLEVKQSAAQQPWSLPRDVKTRGAFDIAPRTGYYVEDGSKFVASPGRCSQVYVFAWNGNFDVEDTPPKTDHRNPDQWEFYVVPTRLLPNKQKTISLSKIEKLAEPVALTELGAAIEDVTRGI